MDAGLYEIVYQILRTVSFIAFGGLLAVLFMVVFAQHILGLKAIHNQLANIERQTERMNAQLETLVRLLESKGKSPSE